MGHDILEEKRVKILKGKPLVESFVVFVWGSDDLRLLYRNFYIFHNLQILLIFSVLLNPRTVERLLFKVSDVVKFYYSTRNQDQNRRRGNLVVFLSTVDNFRQNNILRQLECMRRDTLNWVQSVAR